VASIVAQAYSAAGAALETTLWYRATKRAAPTVTVNGTWHTLNTTATKPAVDGVGLDSCGLYVAATVLGETHFYNDSSDDKVIVDAAL
jgi:hypothetical protein